MLFLHGPKQVPVLACDTPLDLQDHRDGLTAEGVGDGSSVAFPSHLTRLHGPVSLPAPAPPRAPALLGHATLLGAEPRGAAGDAWQRRA